MMFLAGAVIILISILVWDFSCRILFCSVQMPITITLANDRECAPGANALLFPFVQFETFLEISFYCMNSEISWCHHIGFGLHCAMGKPEIWTPQNSKLTYLPNIAARVELFSRSRCQLSQPTSNGWTGGRDVTILLIISTSNLTKEFLFFYFFFK